MSQKTRKVFRVCLTVAGILIALLYLLVCLVPFLNGANFWFISILGLIFPLLLIMVLLCLVITAIRRSRMFFLFLAVLFAGSQQISIAIGFHFFNKQGNRGKSVGTLRVLSWNVSRWDEPNKKKKGGVSDRLPMFDVLRAQNADILFLQEFFEASGSTYFESNLAELKNMGYVYTYFFPTSITVSGQYKYGMVISSKFPIVDSAKFSFGQTPHSEGLMSADIKVDDKLIRVFSTHLESSRTDKYGYFGGGGAGVMSRMKGIGSKLRLAYKYRYEQALQVRQQLDASPYPVVLCGNLGDVPNSSVYFTVKANLQDAFLKHGSGLGGTFRLKAPNLRIDYILADKRIKILNYFRPSVNYSDHYPIISDLEIP